MAMTGYCDRPSTIVSVLLPISRLDEYFEIALSSILTQSLRDIEVLVLANGVSDSEYARLVEMCAADARVILHRLNVCGLMFALNYGIEFSRSEYIARMDADDVSTQDRFEKQLDFLLKNPSVGVVGGRVQLIDSNGKVLNRPYKFFNTHEEIVNVLPYRNPLCHPGLMFRKSALLKVWGYRFGFMSEDHEMFIRMMYAGVIFHNLDDLVLLYRRHSAQITNPAKARAHFAEISAFMWINFYSTKRLAFLLGAIAIYPPVRRVRNFITNLLLRRSSSNGAVNGRGIL